MPARLQLSSRRCAIVAHPDDEALWLGGLILSHPGDWTIICCSVPRRDPIRAWKFFRSCKLLGAQGRLIPQTEPEYNDPLDIENLVDWGEFDLWVTHGPSGEYGHPHHISLYETVKRRAKGEVLFHENEPLKVGVTQLMFVSDDIKLPALKAYDHVLPYPPLGDVPKWEALVHRYREYEPLKQEYYHAR